MMRDEEKYSSFRHALSRIRICDPLILQSEIALNLSECVTNYTINTSSNHIPQIQWPDCYLTNDTVRNSTLIVICLNEKKEHKKDNRG